ncbi:hypothetical protein [Nocardia sp. NPDC056000]|uniref:hypothetical protein n=1 Tax=Nocardia sp. NPDC056000 TaxID=3345674 RepID=UPI0035DD9637
MRALLPAFRTAVVMTALAGAVASGTAIATATAPDPADSAQFVAAGPADAQFVYTSDTGSAVLDLLTMFFNLPTGSLQKPCPLVFADSCAMRPPTSGS